MSLFLSVLAFLLSVAAIIIGAAALRRINGQNEEFLKAYVDEIRNDLLHKDNQITTLRRELAAVRANRSVNRETLRALEQDAARKRQGLAEAIAGDPAPQFVPSHDKPQSRLKKRYVA